MSPPWWGGMVAGGSQGRKIGAHIFKQVQESESKTGKCDGAVNSQSHTQ